MCLRRVSLFNWSLLLFDFRHFPTHLFLSDIFPDTDMNKDVKEQLSKDSFKTTFGKKGCRTHTLGQKDVLATPQGMS